MLCGRTSLFIRPTENSLHLRSPHSQSFPRPPYSSFFSEMICEHSAGGSKSARKKPVSSGRVSVLRAPVSAAFSLRVHVGGRVLRRPWPLLCCSQLLSVPRAGPGSSWASGRARVGCPLLAHTHGHTSSVSHFLTEAARVLGFLLFSPRFPESSCAVDSGWR